MKLPSFFVQLVSIIKELKIIFMVHRLLSLQNMIVDEREPLFYGVLIGRIASGNSNNGNREVAFQSDRKRTDDPLMTTTYPN